MLSWLHCSPCLSVWDLHQQLSLLNNLQLLCDLVHMPVVMVFCYPKIIIVITILVSYKRNICMYIRSYVHTYQLMYSYTLHIAIYVNCVKLTLFVILILAPDLANILTVLVSPFSDALCSGVSPFCNNNNINAIICKS